MRWYEEPESKRKETTKECPVCGNRQLLEISRSNLKVCVDHKPYIRIPWLLSEGQKYRV